MTDTLRVSQNEYDLLRQDSLRLAPRIVVDGIVRKDKSNPDLVGLLDPKIAAMPYSEFVDLLSKPGSEILDQLTADQAELLHMGVGVAGEGGEVSDVIKAHTIYQKPLDRVQLVEELGDLKFFMTRIMTMTGITHEELDLSNKTKLAKRYAKLSYSNEAAVGRADKQ